MTRIDTRRRPIMCLTVQSTAEIDRNQPVRRKSPENKKITLRGHKKISIFNQAGPSCADIPAEPREDDIVVGRMEEQENDKSHK